MVEVRRLTRSEAESAFDDLARLRITVFREYPYLYDGDLDYERDYLAAYMHSQAAVIIGAIVDGRLVGAATAAPLEDHFDEFEAPLRRCGLETVRIFYFGESVLERAWRGQGIGGRFLTSVQPRHGRPASLPAFFRQ
jgi:GNAT superfamily N-acetyltransferase